MKKRVVRFLFSAIIAATVMSAGVYANAQDITVDETVIEVENEEVNNVTADVAFDIQSDAEKENYGYILGLKDEKVAEGDLVIPNIVDGVAVKGIAENAFKESKITSVDMSACTELKTIGASAFSEIETLKSVKFSAATYEIGPYAFMNSALGTAEEGFKLVIPNTIGFINKEAFRGCKYLEEVTFEEGGKTLQFEDANASNASKAFAVCDNLKKVTLAERVKYIPSYAFDNCVKLETVVWSKSLTSIGDSAFNFAGIKSVDLSECSELLYIKEHAFYSAKNITEVKFPESLSEIGKDAFTGASFGTAENMGTLVIPASVDRIGAYAFQGAENLKEVQFEDGKGSIIFEKDTNKCAAFSTISTLETVKLSNRINIASADLFMLSKIKKIEWSDSITKIEMNAFSHMSIEELDLSKCTNLTEIGFEGFASNYSLKKVILPESLGTIGDHAFMGCPLGEEKNLGRIDIPANVTSIGNSAFANSDFLGEVFFADSKESTINKNMTWGKDDQGRGLQFDNCKKLVGVKFNERCAEIPEDMFGYAKDVKHLVFPVDNTDISKLFDTGSFRPDIKNVTIYCNKDSAVYKYAKDNGAKAVKTLAEVPDSFLNINPEVQSSGSHAIIYNMGLGVSANSIANNEKNPTSFDTSGRIKTLKLYRPADRTGYKFLGWYYQDIEKNKLVKVTKITKKMQQRNTDIVLTAHWKPIQYKVVFMKGTKGNTKGVKGKAKKIKADYDELIRLYGQNDAYTREGYLLMGWSDDKNTNDVKYLIGAMVKNLAEKQGKTIKLYAVWLPVNPQ